MVYRNDAGLRSCTQGLAFERACSVWMGDDSWFKPRRHRVSICFRSAMPKMRTARACLAYVLAGWCTLRLLYKPGCATVRGVTLQGLLHDAEL